MPINTTHPSYDEQTEQWETVRDVMTGERAIRANVLRYLPPPPGLNINASIDMNAIKAGGYTQGHNRYTFYASFAEFPELVQGAVSAIQGLIHEKPPTIELPPDMEYLIETATPGGDSIEELWESMTREIFVAGRFGLLTEFIGDDPYICPYVAESIINWALMPKLAGGRPFLVVLREVSQQPKAGDRYELQDVTRWRELELSMAENGSGLIYRVRVWQSINDSEPVIIEAEGMDEEGWLIPSLFGKAFDEIPLSVANAIEKGFRYGPMPAFPMAKRAINIFRKTADYNRALYVKGDPQAVLFGVDPEDVPDMIGGGTIWAFPLPDGKAEYMDIDGDGIPLMRESIMDQYNLFARETGQLVDEVESGAESGEAIRRRQANQQITVKSVVVNAGATMEGHLRQMARQQGKSDTEVAKIIFTPNTDFAEPLMSGRALLEYVMSKNAGAPISRLTIHNLARRHRVTDFDFDEEEKLIEEEEEFNEPLPVEEPDDNNPDDDNNDKDPEDKSLGA